MKAKVKEKIDIYEWFLKKGGKKFDGELFCNNGNIIFASKMLEFCGKEITVENNNSCNLKQYHYVDENDILYHEDWLDIVEEDEDCKWLDGTPCEVKI